MDVLPYVEPHASVALGLVLLAILVLILIAVLRDIFLDLKFDALILIIIASSDSRRTLSDIFAAKSCRFLQDAILVAPCFTPNC